MFTIQRGRHRVIVNLSGEERLVPNETSSPELVFATDAAVRLDPDGLILPPETAGIVR